MTAVLLEPPVTRWECPSCGLRDETREPRVHTRMHACKALAGFTAPMTKVERFDQAATHHRVVERQDYVGSDLVRTDGNGRPVMAIHTERRDGSHDTHTFAPTATVSASSLLNISPAEFRRAFSKPRLNVRRK